MIHGLMQHGSMIIIKAFNNHREQNCQKVIIAHTEKSKERCSPLSFIISPYKKLIKNLRI